MIIIIKIFRMFSRLTLGPSLTTIKIFGNQNWRRESETREWEVHLLLCEIIVMIKTSLLRVFCKQQARVSNHVFNGCEVHVMDKYVLAAGS